MCYKKLKLFIYIFLLLIILPLLIPICSFAFNDNSVYVWSNSTSSISTSIAPSSEELLNTNNSNDSGNFLNISSGSAILIDQITGKVLY